jgi:hypothetical protein
MCIFKIGGAMVSETVCPVLLSFKAHFELVLFFWMGYLFRAVFTFLFYTKPKIYCSFFA